MIDRVAPTQRPGGPNDGTQRWESLLFCHWQVPINLLREIVPAELEIDTFDGAAYVATVPFKMRDIRPNWLPKSLAFNFYETNVRTYVIHRGRPGVYFMSLDASSRLAVWAARKAWALPYYFANMSSSSNGDEMVYDSCRTSRQIGKRCRHRVVYRKGTSLGVSSPGSLEHFLFERYLLFVKRKEQIFVGTVHHKPYEVQTAIIESLEDQLLNASGISGLSSTPELAHFSPGVDVEVFKIVLASGG